MNKHKKDYLTRALLMQFVICTVLFLLLYALKSADSSLFKQIEAMLSRQLEQNLTIEQVQSAFATITPPQDEDAEQKETEYIPLEEPALSAEIIASGGQDIKIKNQNEIPENASINNYKLSENMTLPVINGRVSSEFGQRVHPISKDLRFHTGIDIAADTGTPIYAAFDGEVLFAGYDKWNGNHLKIKHDNKIVTVYCHCESLKVKKGEKIRAGEVVATVGSTGSSTGPHLHFELRIDNVSYNPQNALNEAVSAV